MRGRKSGGRGIRPRGMLHVFRVLEDAHRALAKQLLRERIPGYRPEGVMEVAYEPAMERCDRCGKRMSVMQAPAFMAEPEVHCLSCHGFWPDTIIDWGTDKTADQGEAEGLL